MLSIHLSFGIDYIHLNWLGMTVKYRNKRNSESFEKKPEANKNKKLEEEIELDEGKRSLWFPYNVEKLSKMFICCRLVGFFFSENLNSSCVTSQKNSAHSTREKKTIKLFGLSYSSAYAQHTRTFKGREKVQIHESIRFGEWKTWLFLANFL